MVGLTRYGEAAWAIEQVMNVWLAESRVPTPDLAALLARAEADLSAWTAAIAQAPHADHAIEPLVAAADRVRHGGPFVWLEAVADAPAPQSLEAPAEPAVSPEPAAPAPEPWLHVVEPVDTPADAPVAPEAPFVPVEPVLQANDAVSLSWDDVPVLPASDALAGEAPVLEPVSEPVAEAVTAPEPISEPMVEPIAEPVVEPAAIEPVAEAAAEPAPAEADAKVIPFPFEQTGTPEEASHDDGIKIIGPVYISVALYNVYLQEADALIRRLGVDFSEWRHEGRAQPSELALRAAHTLQGSSAVVELEPVRLIADGLEQVLLNLDSRPVAMHPGDFRLLDQSVERMRGMLHQFAASVWPEADDVLCAAWPSCASVCWCARACSPKWLRRRLPMRRRSRTRTRSSAKTTCRRSRRRKASRRLRRSTSRRWRPARRLPSWCARRRPMRWIRPCWKSSWKRRTSRCPNWASSCARGKPRRRTAPSRACCCVTCTPSRAVRGWPAR